jgi:outer membrane protein TolC
MGGDRIHERSRLNAQHSQAQYLADNVRLDIRSRVGTALGDLRAALTNTPIAAQGEEQVRLYLETMADSYSGGDRTLAEMIDAAETSLIARLDAIGSRFDYFEAASRLVYEVGWSLRRKNITPGDRITQALSEETDKVTP